MSRKLRSSATGTRVGNVQTFSVREFFERFPSDDACLRHVMEVRYGLRHRCAKCAKDSTFHRLADRPAYSCAQCGHHVYPCAGTIFQGSRTSLQVWFYAIYLFIATRHGVSGKGLQRTLGVTYKTAWRMGQQIRILMDKAYGEAVLRGHVEIGGSYVGGHRPGKRGRAAAAKTIVMGVKERGGGLETVIIPDVKKDTLREVVLENVEAGTVVSADGGYSYGLLTPDGYKHGVVKHGAKEWSCYDWRHGVVHHANSVEYF